MPRLPFIAPGTSKKTIFNGLTTKKIVEYLPILSWVHAGGVSAVVTANHLGQTPVTSAGTAEGTITDLPKNRATLLDSSTKEPIETPGGQTVFARLTEAAGVWTLSFYYFSGGLETAYNLPAGTYDYYYASRTNLKVVADDWAVQSIGGGLPIDADKYASDIIVDPTGITGTHTTLTGAFAAATDGDIIFVKASDYTAEGALTMANNNILLLFSEKAIIQQLSLTGNDITVIGGEFTNVRISGNRAHLERLWVTTTISINASLTKLTVENCRANNFQTSGICNVSELFFFKNKIITNCQLQRQLPPPEPIFSKIYMIGNDLNLLKIDGEIDEHIVISNNTISGNLTLIGRSGSAFVDVIIDGNDCSGALSVQDSLGVTPKNLRIFGNYFAGGITMPTNYDDSQFEFGNETKLLQRIAGNPTVPIMGDTWFDTTTSRFKGYNGGATVFLDAGGGIDSYAANIIIEPTGTTGTHTTVTAGFAAASDGDIIVIKNSDYTGEGIVTLSNNKITLIMGEGVLLDRLDITSANDVTVIGGNIDDWLRIANAAKANYFHIERVYVTNEIEISSFGAEFVNIENCNFDYLLCNGSANGISKLTVSDNVVRDRIDLNQTAVATNYTSITIKNNNLIGTPAVNAIYLRGQGIVDISVLNNTCLSAAGAGEGIMIANQAGIANDWMIEGNKIPNWRIRTSSIGVSVDARIVNNICNGLLLFGLSTNSLEYGNETKLMQRIVGNPVTPIAGDTWFDTTATRFKGYNGASVVLLDDTSDIYAADLIVDPSGNTGTHTTITSALAAASDGDIIFVKYANYAAEGALTIANNGITLILAKLTVISSISIQGNYCTIIGGGTANISSNGYNHIELLRAPIGTLDLDNCTDVTVTDCQIGNIDILNCNRISLIGNYNTTDCIIDTCTTGQITGNYFSGTAAFDTLEYFAIGDNNFGGSCDLDGPMTSVIFTDNISVGGTLNIDVSGGGNSEFRVINNIFVISITGSIDELTELYNDKQNAFPIRTADPGSPSEGDNWYNNNDKQFKGYDGTNTVILG